MKPFSFVNAKTIHEAVSLSKAYGTKTKLIAGGTDLLGELKDRVLLSQPEVLVNLKTIPFMDHIKEEEAVLRIGALTKLDQIATSPIVNEKYNALAQAARSVGSPQIRNMGTIGGNLCQDVRCCYYRASPWCGPSFICLRKGGRVCYAVAGDNRYHSIFGGKKGCFAVCPSDMAPALVALNAQVKTSKRTAKLEELFHHSTSTILDTDEIVTEIMVPNPSGGTKSTYIKFALRKAVDFAIVSIALVLTVNGGACEDVKIVLGGVAPNPWRPKAAEDSIQGKPIDARIAEAASAAAVAEAIVLSDNRYKVQIAKTLVKRALLACI